MTYKETGSHADNRELARSVTNALIARGNTKKNGNELVFPCFNRDEHRNGDEHPSVTARPPTHPPHMSGSTSVMSRGGSLPSATQSGWVSLCSGTSVPFAFTLLSFIHILKL